MSWMNIEFDESTIHPSRYFTASITQTTVTTYKSLTWRTVQGVGKLFNR